MAGNCYLVSEASANETLIVDPGDEADFITRIILERDLKPKAIILTHGHFDHVMVAGELFLTLGVPIFGNFKDKFLLSRARKALPVKLNSNLKEGQKLPLGKYKFVVWETPGHTPGSICLIERKEKIAIVGDLVFADGSFGRYDFSYSRKDKLLASVKRILSLAPNTRIYPGHGEEFLIKRFGT